MLEPSPDPDATAQPPLVGVVMGSTSDWEVMRNATETLAQLRIPFEARVVSAHRTPDLLFSYAAEAEGRGLAAILAPRFPVGREALQRYRREKTERVLAAQL